VNYIKEVNAFYDWLVYNPLPTGAIALWNALISINNKAGWAEEFTVANLTLQALTGLSRQGLDRARNILVQKGLIEYKKGTSNKAGKYKLISLECQKVGTTKGTVVDAEDDTEDLECQKIGTEHDTKRTQNDTQSGHSSSTLNKLNKTKLNKINNSSCSSNSTDMGEIYKYYEQAGFGVINGKVAEFLDAMVEVYSKEWVIKAIDQAVKNAKYNLKYVEGILQNWKRNGGIQENKPKAEVKSSKKVVNHPYINYSGQRQYDVSELEKNLLGKGELSNG